MSFSCQQAFVVFCGVCEISEGRKCCLQFSFKNKLKAPNPIKQTKKKLTQMQTCTLLLTFVCIKRIWGKGIASVDSVAVSVRRKYSSCNFSTNTLPAQPHQFVFSYLFTCLHLRAALERFLCYVENLSSFILSS